jgi:hypothetical protein
LARAPDRRVGLTLEAAAALALGGGVSSVRGLTPAALLEEMAAGLELERVARRLDPPASGPWYARDGDDAAAPEALSGAVALYALCRRGPDPEYTAAVAYSIGRLTHASPGCLGRAVLAALALQETVGGLPGAPSPAARGLAQRWSGWTPAASDCERVRARSADVRGFVTLPSDVRASLLRLLAASAS